MVHGRDRLIPGVVLGRDWDNGVVAGLVQLATHSRHREPDHVIELDLRPSAADG